MAAFCLPKKDSARFMAALRSGSLRYQNLRDMSSAERRAEFGKLFGEDTAREVNAVFEKNLLLKDQQRGFASFVRQISGIDEATRQTISDRINNMTEVLQPASERAFLQDLVNKKLKIDDISASEARSLFNASQRVQSLKDAISRAPDTQAARIAYGRSLLDLHDLVESMKPYGTTFDGSLRSALQIAGNVGIDALGVPKAALTSVLHLSAPFVQGWGMLSTKNAWVGFGKMFQYFHDEENYKNLNAWIVSHPDYVYARDAKLGLTSLDDRLTDREEAIQSTLLESFNKYLSDKTGVPNLVRASSRAFTGYLNYVRFSRFSDLLQSARMTGEDVRIGSQVNRDIAKVVNNFTGRGAIGTNETLQNAAPVLNAVFFSPRKLSATVNMFSPLQFLSYSPTARMAAVRQLSGSLAGTVAAAYLAKSMGASVDFDPRSTNFLKIDIGGQLFDITGGNAIYGRLIARTMTDSEITSKGKMIEFGQGYKPMTRMDTAIQFLRGKLSPIAGTLSDALYGSDSIGRPFDLSQETYDKLTPIVMKSFIDYYMNNPDDTAALIPSLAAVFGVSEESPLPPLARDGLSVWGEQAESRQSKDPVDLAMKSLEFQPQFPPKTINSIPLNDDQYKQYIVYSGQAAKELVSSYIQSDGWNRLSPAVQLSMVKSAINTARNMAQSAIIGESYGSDNDIMKKSMDKKISEWEPQEQNDETGAVGSSTSGR